MKEGAFVYHPASAPGEGGVALLELYGEGAARALEELFRPRGGKMPSEGEVRLGLLQDRSGHPLDEVLLARVSAEASWCGLPGWCLSCHGGAMASRRIAAELDRAGGRREDREGVAALARAAGALDRLRSEARVRLPLCRTARAARYLLRMGGGELSRRLQEAVDAPGDGAGALRRFLEEALDAAPAVLRLTVPRRILLAGRPNAGKSSLFNRLARRERAAVTPLAGTTRDLLEEMVEVAGFPVVFIDSAGLRADGAEDPVEWEGMRRAREAEVDSVLFLIDRPGPPAPDEDAAIARWPPDSLLIVRAKADLYPLADREAGPDRREAGFISTATGEGLGALRERVRREWLGPPESVELPPAPFTAALVEAFSAAARAPSVDGMRKVLRMLVT